MFRIDDSNVITLTRGDTCDFDVEIKTDSGQTYTPQEGDVITFTVKKDTKTADVIIQKIGSTIVLNPIDTKNLNYGLTVCKQMAALNYEESVVTLKILQSCTVTCNSGKVKEPKLF